jgi:ATP-dependent DNA helicase DinG
VPEISAVSGTTGLTAAVSQTFSGQGPLARVLPGFEPREGQRAMAGAVAGTMAAGGVLLAEAGTGTGKTLAYLVPAILSRRRVLISTGTKNLQEQIYFKDIPALREALGVPFTATYMKGRGNYLCLHRFETFAGTGSDAERIFLPVIREWAAATETGDRAEVEDLPEDLPFWTEISATTEQCLGADCPRYDECFVTRMRRRAAQSDLVIVNHQLLCADAAVRQSSDGEVIPECQDAIIDEAHQLEDVATQYFGLSVSTYRLDELVRDTERLLGARAGRERQQAAGLREDARRVQDRARSFFGALQQTGSPPGAEGGAGAGGWWRPRGPDARVRITADSITQALEPGRSLGLALEQLEAALALLKDAPPDALGLAGRARTIRDELLMLLRADDPDYVFYLETRGRGVFLRASPIDVSAIVRELLLDRMHTVVLTSATLAVEGAFDYVRSRLGIGTAGELRLPSEFEYARQAILYLPRRMPHPRQTHFAQAAAREVVQILRRTQGRAFVLFTSYANLRAVHEIAAQALDFPLFVQGTAPRSILLRDFRTTPHAVLLATSSFWQGVDVAGEALSCVVIDKLPFASPGDPVTAARIEAIAARGGAPFDEYQIPLAILTLQQGLGRLIRHRRDRGVLAILDPRLRSMGYGRRFLAALPPAPVTAELDDITRFLADA